MKVKKVLEMLVVIIYIVLLNDMNILGNLFGGQLLVWMDVIVSVFVYCYSKCVVVMVLVNNVFFNWLIVYGFFVMFEVKVLWVFFLLMEVIVDVFVEDLVNGKCLKFNEVIYMFVVVD